MDFSRRELESLRRALARVAGEAVAMLWDRVDWSQDLLAVVGEHGGDESMRIDVEAEREVMELLASEGIKGLFVGEESGAVRMGGDPYVVVVDPLDGSKNFAGCVPWFAVSIALAPLFGERTPTLTDVVVGAVAPCFKWPVLSFAKGLGAFEGGSPARFEARTSRLVFAYVEDPDQARVVYEYLREVGFRRGVRALGSASLEVAWTAMGRAEVFIDVRGKLRTVDVAAAAGFALELGARVAVEKPQAPLTEPTVVGSVVVGAGEHWGKLSRALERVGLGWLARRQIAWSEALEQDGG